MNQQQEIENLKRVVKELGTHIGYIEAREKNLEGPALMKQVESMQKQVARMLAREN